MRASKIVVSSLQQSVGKKTTCSNVRSGLGCAKTPWRLKIDASDFGDVAVKWSFLGGWLHYSQITVKPTPKTTRRHVGDYRVVDDRRQTSSLRLFRFGTSSSLILRPAPKTNRRESTVAVSKLDADHRKLKFRF